MSDVSKTGELIAEARDWLKRGPVAGNGTEIMRGLAGALEAATRAAQGGPDGDSEALMEAVNRGEKAGQAAWSAYGQEPDGEGVVPHPDNWYRVEALMAAGFSRAAVPDAATAAIERAKFKVDSAHHIHGTECLCGFSSHRSRSRTEHITGALVAALDGAPEVKS